MHNPGLLHRTLNGLANLFFPPVCPICRQTLWRTKDGLLCGACAIEHEPTRPPFCSTCGRPFDQSAPAHRCQDCLLDPPPYRHLRSAFEYKGELRHALLAFKMKRDASRARSLAGLLLLTGQMGIRWEAYDCVVPVPLHDNRLRWRGYNQCGLLLKEAAAVRPIRVRRGVLSRTRETTPQFMASAGEKVSNVAGAFACATPEAVSGGDVLLVDDIVTSGATIAECARVLIGAGAKTVDVAVLARSLPD